MSGVRVLALAPSLAAMLTGCAVAEPMLLGGRTVPRSRTDIATGAAVRVPVGDLVPQPGVEADALALAFGAPSGAAPVAFVRHGIADGVELGVEAAGSSLRASVRGEIGLGGPARLVLGAVPHAGAVAALGEPDDQAAFRGGGLVQAAIALELFSLYELWIGARAGLEHVAGDLSGSSLRLSGLRTGGVLGLAVGFRRFHVLLELGVDHELWWGAVGERSIGQSGLALTPAFALRLRL